MTWTLDLAFAESQTGGRTVKAPGHSIGGHLEG
jgi:hypothetical protein